MFTAIGSDRPTDRTTAAPNAEAVVSPHLYVKYSDLTVLSVLNSLGCGEVSQKKEIGPASRPSRSPLLHTLEYRRAWKIPPPSARSKHAAARGSASESSLSGHNDNR